MFKHSQIYTVLSQNLYHLAMYCIVYFYSFRYRSFTELDKLNLVKFANDDFCIIVKSIFTTPELPKNYAHFQSDQKRLKNNHKSKSVHTLQKTVFVPEAHYRASWEYD